MTKRYWIREDKLPSKLFVNFSTKITKEIDFIDTYNQSNKEGLSKWHDYLDGIVNYVSNPVIAWDYTNRYPRFPNGARFIGDFDFNVGLTIQTKKHTNQSYVYVFMINLKPEEFGLKVPPNMNESRNAKKKLIRLTETDLHTDLHRIIKESIYEVLNKLKNPVVG